VRASSFGLQLTQQKNRSKKAERTSLFAGAHLRMAEKINEKCLGGVKAQKSLLENEGHKVI
jgi:hypothetical protein